ncbi:hypothetical protein [Bacillus fonticola]|uniref:hypothetical protein n=1 Tax=Bacillus fonticola TaxID=2728853 RepID=UPI0014762FE3|nr:hypothetical protein [Bacillus fonticola]
MERELESIQSNIKNQEEGCTGEIECSAFYDCSASSWIIGQIQMIIRIMTENRLVSQSLTQLVK